MAFPSIQILAVICAIFPPFVSTLKIWDTPAALGTLIPAGCRAALTTNITCPGKLITAAEIVNQVPQNETFLEQYCEPACRDSLQSFATLVNTRCGDTVYSFGNYTKQSGNAIAVPLLWSQDVACLEDSTTHSLCLPSITNHTIEACDDCTLKYLSGLLNSTYGHRRVRENSFSSLASSCSVDPTAYPHGTVTFPPAPTSTANSSAPCLGTEYTVAEGDTCESIAEANHLAYYRLLSDNGIDLNCESLAVGNTLCVGDSCTLHTVRNPPLSIPRCSSDFHVAETLLQVAANETCKDILADQDFTITELLAWNPIIHTKCDNLASLVNRTICVSPPGSDDWDIPITVSYNDTWTLPTGDWAPLPSATEASNVTYCDPHALGSIGTVTATANVTYSSLGASRITDCPVVDQDIERGFDLALLPEDCSSSMEPYCTPFLDEPAPPSTTFASSCLPSVIMGW
ncbi:hypothetical protein P168DRAFT_318263 [Aspergillus campestris IBT 28561]|uniref:LysM domain-containing protein n=1 Tax=Aspergillus campestris (strain IBT 28561) TaxID=1392248 RepID=A0A2I1D5T2_ASPC2|nr:uncharacterized protein P168DRAFT_318263 [Aspergillus campestris IBT 28561]PKY05237.1 hypothetical protein P168DRAFT_318263 [Aspergillus campestris IBT 28561]